MHNLHIMQQSADLCQLFCRHKSVILCKKMQICFSCCFHLPTPFGVLRAWCFYRRCRNHSHPIHFSGLCPLRFKITHFACGGPVTKRISHPIVMTLVFYTLKLTAIGQFDIFHVHPFCTWNVSWTYTCMDNASVIAMHVYHSTDWTWSS